MIRICIPLLVFLLFGSASVFAGASLGTNETAWQSNRPAQASRNEIATCDDMSSEDATKLGLIRQMLGEGRPHAAIAHLDAARISNPQADLLRADGLRQTGREIQAEAIYKRLQGSCVNGYAYQGLGLIASKAGDTQEAIRHLRTASEALPTEYTIRNDYGYALMMAGESQLAVHEFLTAIELADGYRQPAHNLILLLYRNGDIGKAQAFASQLGIGAEDLGKLEKMAQLPLTSAEINRDGLGRVLNHAGQTIAQAR